MKRVYALIVAVMMVLPIPAMADFATMGMGNTTCSKLGNDLSNPAIEGAILEVAMMSWVQGYMSGRNVEITAAHQYRDMAAISVEDLKRRLFAYCNDHPFAQIIEAATNLYFSLPLKQFTPPNAASHR